MNISEYIVVSKAAQQAGVSREAIYKAIQRGMLKAAEIRNKTHVQVDSLERYVQFRTRSVVPGLITLEEAAEQLGVTKGGVRSAIRNGHIDVERFGRYFMIREASLMPYAKKIQKRQRRMALRFKRDRKQ